MVYAKCRCIFHENDTKRVKLMKRSKSKDHGKILKSLRVCMVILRAGILLCEVAL